MVKLKIRSDITSNIRWVGFFFLILLSVVSARAFTLQILKSEWLKVRLEDQSKKKIPISSRRGTIYDRNGSELAVSLDVDSLYARPGLVKDKKNTAQKLTTILGIPRDKILNILQSKQSFVWLKRQIAPEQSEKIKGLGIKGIGFIREARRFYPNRELAGQLLGFVGVDSQGLEGIESAYNRVIGGKSGYLLVNKDALGRDLFPEGVNAVDSERGYDLTLTIDKNIQYIAEKELQTAVTNAQAQGGLAVVMNPRTGEILALAVAPSFNPNQGGINNTEAWKNRAVTDVFEPGSIFKTILVGSALEEGVVKPDDIYNCENGSYGIGKRVIHDVHPHGLLSVREVIKYSSNIGASKIARHLGKDQFYQYIKKFGFSQETGVELPGEVRGYVPPSSQWRDINLATISFGQGISVTALQVVIAYATIANDGVLMRPYLVKEIRDATGTVIQKTEPTVSRRVLEAQHAHTLTEMLETVTQPGGTGLKAAVEGFSVAGKTGTAQKIAAHGKGYSNKCISSFVGYVPANDPALAIVVVIDEPKGITYGGVVAAPAFSAMAQQILCYQRVYPESSYQQLHSNRVWQETRTIFPGEEEQG
jgi:cell division protein FtsI (penicillin-binding protein 3)